MQQEVVLAMLAKEPSQGYQLRARMNDALGPLGEALNAGQVYVTLGRLEKAGLVAVEETPGSTGPADRDRKVYVLTAAGQQLGGKAVLVRGRRAVSQLNDIFLRRGV
ncbi:MAG: PadR family transcriptional regulator, partial [Trebonia sp.]